VPVSMPEIVRIAAENANIACHTGK
jgi:hypothetical protein